MTSYSRRRREDLFASIARGKGGASKVLLEPEVLAQAQRKLEELKPIALAETQAAIRCICLLAEARAGSDKIFAVAHDIKGLVGAYGFAGVGMVAGAIRVYGENRPPGFEPDWSLLQLLIETMARAFENPTAVSRQVLATTCYEAVGKVMAREGRDIPDGLL